MRTTTGIADLDALLEGGFPGGRSILVCGAEGTGKTTMGLQFLVEGLALGEPGTFVTVDEKPGHLIEDAGRLGWDLAASVDGGQLTILDASPFFTATRGANGNHPGIDVREVASDLVQEVRRIGARRLVIDTITSLIPLTGDAHAYLRALVQSLDDNSGCTTILTCRATRRHDSRGTCESTRALAAGVIELRAGLDHGTPARTLTVRKMRGTAVGLAERPMSIDTGYGISLIDEAGSSQARAFTPRPVAAAAPPPSSRPEAAVSA